MCESDQPLNIGKTNSRLISRKPTVSGQAKERILLTHWRSPGDTVCMTACVRDLALQYPGQYEIHVAGSCPEIWENNPHVAKVWGPRPPRNLPTIRLSCQQQMAESQQIKRHYLTAFHHNLQSHLAIDVPVRFAQGDLHLSAEEQNKRPVKGRYWLVVAGGKDDMPAKIWSAGRFQEVVTKLKKEGIQCVQGGALLPGHRHPRLNDVIDRVGKLDLRGFLRLIYHADGVICPVTFAMHAAAAFNKPCVVIAGGREPWWWEAYVNSSHQHFGENCAPVLVPHRFLHSIGQLDCCRATGCWKTHVLTNHSIDRTRLCELPVDDGLAQVIPRCLSDIRVNDVVSAVLSHYQDGPHKTYIPDQLADVVSKE